ncbi:uncharacterized protein V6R79_006689 [Siganus canaliculatus]
MHAYICRVHIREQLEQLSGEVLSAGQKKTMAAVDTSMKEAHAFSRMEEDHGITMKIRGATMVTIFIFLLNAELFHLQEGKTIHTEYPGKTHMQDGLWSLEPGHHILIVSGIRVSIHHPGRFQRVVKTH